MLLSLSPASALQFWFTRAGDTTPITELMVAPGEVINLSVWVQHDTPIKGIELMVGWDTAIRRGSTGTPLDNKVVLNGDLDTAVTNITTAFGDPIAKLLAGARHPGEPSTQNNGQPRPWGLRLTLATLSNVNVSGGLRIVDVSLRNQGVMPGDAPYPVVVWDAGVGSSYTTVVTLADGNLLRPGGSTTLNLVPVPEPGGLMALATGIVGLAGMALRRRRA